MNKTIEYMAFELPVVAFDLRETRVSAGAAAVYAEPNRVDEYARAIVELLDDEPRRKEMGATRPAPHRGRAGVGAPGTELRRASTTDSWRAARTPAKSTSSAKSGLSHVRHRGLLSARGRARCSPARWPTCSPTAAPTRTASTTSKPTNVRCTLTHRRLSIIDLSDAGTPAVHEGRPVARLQRRALQLPRAARRARRGGRSVPNGVRHRSRARGVAALRRRGAHALSRHVRVRALRRADAAISSSRVTSSASSRSSTSRRRRDGSVVFASELKAIAKTVGDELESRSRDARCVDRSTTGFPTSGARSRTCASSRRERWAEFRPDGTRARPPVLVDRRRGARKPRPDRPSTSVP